MCACRLVVCEVCSRSAHVHSWTISAHPQCLADAWWTFYKLHLIVRDKCQFVRGCLLCALCFYINKYIYIYMYFGKGHLCSDCTLVGKVFVFTIPLIKSYNSPSVRGVSCKCWWCRLFAFTIVPMVLKSQLTRCSEWVVDARFMMGVPPIFFNLSNRSHRVKNPLEFAPSHPDQRTTNNLQHITSGVLRGTASVN